MNPVEINQVEWSRERFRLAGHRSWETPFALWGQTSRPAGLSVVTGLQLDPDSAGEQIGAILRSFQVAKSQANWFIGPSATPHGLAMMLRRDWHLLGPMHVPGMELSLTDRRVAAPEHFSKRIDDWDAITAEGHPYATWVRKGARQDTIALLRELEALGNTHCFVTYVNGVLASCATLFVTDGIAGIYDVITQEYLQGRGGATAAVTCALQFACDLGCSRAILQSHKDAIGVYARLGFEATGEFVGMYYSRPRMEADARRNGLR